MPSNHWPFFQLLHFLKSPGYPSAYPRRRLMSSNLPQTRPPRRATSRCLAGGMPVYRCVCVKVKTLSTFSGANSRRQRSTVPRVPRPRGLPQDPLGQHPRYSDPSSPTSTLTTTSRPDSQIHGFNTSHPQCCNFYQPSAETKYLDLDKSIKRLPTVPRSPETQQKTTLATEPSTAAEAVQSITTAP